MLKPLLNALSIAHGRLSAFQQDAYRADLFSFRFFTKHQIIINRTSLVRRVMLDEKGTFPKHPAVADALGPLVGDGVFVSHGKHWETSRDAFDDWLDGAALRQFYDHMQNATTALVARLNASRGEEVDLEREMTRVTADIIHRSIFDEPVTPMLMTALDTSFAEFRRASQAMFPSLLMGIPSLRTPLIRRSLRRSGSRIRAATADSLKAYLKRPSDEGGLIARLQDARLQRGLSPLTDEQLVDEVVVVLLAGHETSAAALTWTFLMLAEHPDWQAQVHEELDAIPHGEAISLSSLSRLVNLRSVIRETLRLMPPIPIYPRRAEEPCQFAGRSYPEGSSLIVCPWLIHRREGAWVSADQFDPSRFADRTQKQAVAKAYLPFGLGPRACPGAGFALQEATLILAEVLRRYRVSARVNHPLKPRADLTLRPPANIRFSIETRRPA